MEERGIISGYQGSKPREVLMSKERWQELKMTKLENTEDNRITLITCVENRPELRRCIQAKEI